jgi:hypothetical protein
VYTFYGTVLQSTQPIPKTAPKDTFKSHRRINSDDLCVSDENDEKTWLIKQFQTRFADKLKMKQS